MKYAFAALLISLAGCDLSQQAQGPSYIEQVEQAPIPRDEVGRRQACDDVRNQLADQQSREQISQSGVLPPLLAMSADRQFSARIAALENRASALQCTAAFSSAPAPAATQIPANGIKECIAACLENTGRTKSQCFDSCNH